MACLVGSAAPAVVHHNPSIVWRPSLTSSGFVWSVFRELSRQSCFGGVSVVSRSPRSCRRRFGVFVCSGQLFQSVLWSACLLLSPSSRCPDSGVTPVFHCCENCISVPVGVRTVSVGICRSLPGVQSHSSGRVPLVSWSCFVGVPVVSCRIPVRHVSF